MNYRNSDETSWRFGLIPSRMAKINKTANNKYWGKRAWGKRRLHLLLVGLQTSAATLKTSVENIQKAKNTSAICSYTTPKDLTSIYSTETCSAEFIADLFTVGRG